ncbi:MAG: metalloprotease, partial [Bacteroidota bacterium]
MIKKLFIYTLLILLSTTIAGQNKIDIVADIDVDTKTIIVTQRVVYKNTTKDTLSTIYFNDWNNSYSTKSTPLAKRFEEEFSTKFHLAKSEQRGFTTVTSIKNQEGNLLDYSNHEDHPDVIKVELASPLLPGQSYDLELNYTLLVPDDTFTNYGVDKNKDYNLKYWYITPAVYNGQWHYYSNKNLDDLYIPKADISLSITHPRNYTIVSELDVIDLIPNGNSQTSTFYGKDRVDTFLSVSRIPSYSFIQTDDFTVISDVRTKGLPPQEKALLTDKITRFLTENLGPYPHKRLIVSDIEYRKNPLYGLNQLPDILRPYPDNFQFELKLLKTALKRYLDNVSLTNPRKDYWINEGLQIYFLMKYVEEYYPDTKLLGKLSNIWGIRSFHAAEVDFNFQYFLFFMEMARKNRDQPLTMPKDSLIKFNANIANKYKAGVGLNYLDDFADDINLQERISAYIKNNALQTTTTSKFEAYLKQQTSKDINWFFDD